jgi:hypothetical protein
MPSLLPSPIERAIDRVAEQHASPQLLTIPVWHPVVLAPGSRWELREVKDGADLWTPGAEHG